MFVLNVYLRIILCFFCTLFFITSITLINEILPNKKISFFGFITLANAANTEPVNDTGVWLDSEKLQPGMKVVTHDNKILTVHSKWQKRVEPETTYNFSVNHGHTYFVSESNIWVHNTCEGDNRSRFRRWWDRVSGREQKAIDISNLKAKRLEELDEIIDDNLVDLSVQYSKDNSFVWDYVIKIKDVTKAQNNVTRMGGHNARVADFENMIANLNAFAKKHQVNVVIDLTKPSGQFANHDLRWAIVNAAENTLPSQRVTSTLIRITWFD